MVLKSISELRRIDAIVINIYKQDLVREGWEEADAQRVLTDITASYAVEVPASSIVASFVLAFFTEYNINWSFIYENTKVCTESHKIIKWSYKEQYHYLFLSEEQANEFIATNTANQLLGNPTTLTSLLANPPEGFSEHRDYLVYLGLIEGEPIEILPKLSGSLDISENTTRFSSAIWFEEIQKKTVILAGLGGIGRFGNLVCFL